MNGENWAQVSHMREEDDMAEEKFKGDSRSLNKKSRRISSEGHYKNTNFENIITT